MTAGCGPSGPAADQDDVTDADPLRVAIDTGTVVGTVGEEGAAAFLGIPYAQPPTGPLRFRSPQPHPVWSTPFDATSFPPKCMQWSKDGIAGEENCLALNVWRPMARSGTDSPLPVLVYIHGGGNVTGSTSEEPVSGMLLYDGGALSARGQVVVVTVQYRLNALGFLSDGALGGDEPAGNYGLKDQVAALGWVKRNAAAFGGDPTRVMLFGESGGGADVCALLATPAAAGLFHAAIVMSGGCGGHTQTEVADWSAETIASVGCDAAADRAACLRAVEPAQLVEASHRVPTSGGVSMTPAGPTVDGDFLPEIPSDAFAAGRHHHVPVIVGTTSEETSSRLFGIPLILTKAAYEARVHAMFPVIGDLVLQMYPADDYPSPRAALVAVTSDWQFVCPARYVVRALQTGQEEAVYRYVYSHRFQGSTQSGWDPGWLGAAHGNELLFVFQALDRSPEQYAATNSERHLERVMLELWTSFARDGVPASKDAPAWPQVTASSDAYLDLHIPPTSGAGYRTEQCDFWESFAP